MKLSERMIREVEAWREYWYKDDLNIRVFDWADEVAQLEAERYEWANEHGIAVQLLDGFKERVRQLEATNRQLLAALDEAYAKENRIEVERDAIIKAFKPLLDRALPHKWRGTIEIQCTYDEFKQAMQALATRKEGGER